MKLVTAEEMRQLDHAAINDYEIPGIVLMENAGTALMSVIREQFPESLNRGRILIFAGKGNNGGDGLVIARHLANAGCDVKVFLLCKPEELQGDALINWNIIRKMNLRYQLITTDRDLNLVKVGLMYTELIIDGIFGTGFKGQAQGTVARLIDLVNESGKPVLAIDLPSGMEADTGRVKGPCIQAQVTVTMGLPKIGMVLDPAAKFVGKLITADISFPYELISQGQFTRDLLDQKFCRNLFPLREKDGHKGSYGHVVVIGGSPGMTGAVALSSWAAVRSGAGLVTAAIPAGLNGILENKLTEAMSLPLPETQEGSISTESLELLRKILPRKVAVLGPGLSRHQEAQGLVRGLVRDVPCPLVVDADALYTLKECGELLENSSYPVILTPHPGEMSRLIGKTVAEIQNDRVGAVTECARRYRSIVVLKGARTLIATPEGHLYVNTTGNSGMATGGSGDVLAGMIGAFLAQGLEGVSAVTLAVYIHGQAGDLAAAERSQTGLAAGDIIEYLPKIFLGYEG
ncbi:NAD(P)H-hydrate dehydratase [Dehalobacterium formicoaceticum]|uniref:NAD(P)H-hydrate dehydratase n=1 Tax=Dehalobacterium formicoaceticum TaxID=51515 RepID=UPI0031F68C97